jgi:hypothetical protein
MELDQATAQMALLEKRILAAEAKAIMGRSMPAVLAAADAPPRSSEIAQRAASAPDSPTGLDIEDEAPVPPADKKLGMVEHQRAALRLLEETLLHDTIDPGARNAAATLGAASRGEEFVGVQVGIDCRQTICGIKLHSESRERTQRAMQLVAEKLPWQGSGMSYLDFASGEATVYVSREGSTLPQLSQL